MESVPAGSWADGKVTVPLAVRAMLPACCPFAVRTTVPVGEVVPELATTVTAKLSADCEPVPEAELERAVTVLSSGASTVSDAVEETDNPLWLSPL